MINEDLRDWFGTGNKGGTGGGGWDRYNSSGDRIGKCGDSKEGDAYAACLSKEKARKLGKSGRAAFVKRKRAAQSKGGDAKKGGEHKKGQKPIKVKTGITEAQGRTLHVYDFDDTLVKTRANIIVKRPDGSKYELDSHAFATHKLKPGESYNFSNFDKIIQTSLPIQRNIEQIKQSLRNPAIKTTILTARRVAFPIMKHLRDHYDIDAYVIAVGSSDPEVKADWIESQVRKGYYNVKFMDDSAKNLDAVARRLSNKKVNLTLINALTDKPYKIMEQKEHEFNLFLEKNIPTQPDKWAYAKSQAKKKFDVYPSAYANAWAAKKYKQLGGKWRTSESSVLKLESDLLSVSKPYEFQIGDMVRNINPSCKHYKSTGSVIAIQPDGDITYKVNNQGATYTPGDELTKSMGQLLKVFTHTPRPGYGMFSNE